MPRQAGTATLESGTLTLPSLQTLRVLKNKRAGVQTPGLNEQWDVTEVAENDLIGTMCCLIKGLMDLLQGPAKWNQKELWTGVGSGLGKAAGALDMPSVDSRVSNTV